MRETLFYLHVSRDPRPSPRCSRWSGPRRSTNFTHSVHCTMPPCGAVRKCLHASERNIPSVNRKPFKIVWGRGRFRISDQKQNAKGDGKQVTNYTYTACECELVTNRMNSRLWWNCSIWKSNEAFSPFSRNLNWDQSDRKVAWITLRTKIELMNDFFSWSPYYSTLH